MKTSKNPHLLTKTKIANEKSEKYKKNELKNTEYEGSSLFEGMKEVGKAFANLSTKKVILLTLAQAASSSKLFGDQQSHESKEIIKVLGEDGKEIGQLKGDNFVDKDGVVIANKNQLTNITPIDNGALEPAYKGGENFNDISYFNLGNQAENRLNRDYAVGSETTHSASVSKEQLEHNTNGVKYFPQVDENKDIDKKSNLRSEPRMLEYVDNSYAVEPENSKFLGGTATVGQKVINYLYSTFMATIDSANQYDTDQINNQMINHSNNITSTYNNAKLGIENSTLNVTDPGSFNGMEELKTFLLDSTKGAISQTSGGTLTDKFLVLLSRVGYSDGVKLSLFNLFTGNVNKNDTNINYDAVANYVNDEKFILTTKNLFSNLPKAIADLNAGSTDSGKISNAISEYNKFLNVESGKFDQMQIDTRKNLRDVYNVNMTLYEAKFPDAYAAFQKKDGSTLLNILSDIGFTKTQVGFIFVQLGIIDNISMFKFDKNSTNETIANQTSIVNETILTMSAEAGNSDVDMMIANNFILDLYAEYASNYIDEQSINAANFIKPEDNKFPNVLSFFGAVSIMAILGYLTKLLYDRCRKPEEKLLNENPQVEERNVTKQKLNDEDLMFPNQMNEFAVPYDGFESEASHSNFGIKKRFNSDIKQGKETGLGIFKTENIIIPPKEKPELNEAEIQTTSIKLVDAKIATDHQDDENAPLLTRKELTLSHTGYIHIDPLEVSPVIPKPEVIENKAVDFDFSKVVLDPPSRVYLEGNIYSNLGRNQIDNVFDKVSKALSDNFKLSIREKNPNIANVYKDCCANGEIKYEQMSTEEKNAIRDQIKAKLALIDPALDQARADWSIDKYVEEIVKFTNSLTPLEKLIFTMVAYERNPTLAPKGPKKDPIPLSTTEQNAVLEAILNKAKLSFEDVMESGIKTKISKLEKQLSDINDQINSNLSTVAELEAKNNTLQKSERYATTGVVNLRRSNEEKINTSN